MWAHYTDEQIVTSPEHNPSPNHFPNPNPNPKSNLLKWTEANHFINIFGKISFDDASKVMKIKLQLY